MSQRMFGIGYRGSRRPPDGQSPSGPPLNAARAAVNDLTCPGRQTTADWVATACVVLAVPWCLWHLGHLPLWDDEAHTLLIAQGILRTGIPLVWDGTHFISGANGNDIGHHLLLTWDGPLQFYLVACAIALFGVSEWSARLPFVLAGLATLPLLYLLARRVTQNPWVGVGAIVLLLTNAPFLTHIRQCRWYSLSLFFLTLLLYGYYGLNRRRRDFVWFLFGGIGLFYTNPFSFIIIWPCLAVHCVIARRETLRSFAIGSGGMAIVTLPWFFFAALYAKQATVLKPGWLRYAYRVTELIYKCNRFLFPLALWAALPLLWRRLRNQHAFCGLALALYVIPMFAIAKMLPPACRYVLWFLPIAMLVQMLMVQACWQRSRRLGVGLFALLLISNGFVKLPVLALRLPLYWATTDYTVHRREPLSTYLPQALRKTFGRFQYNNRWYFETDWWWKSLFKMDLAAYWHEVTHPYRDPIDSLAEFFAMHAAPGDQALMAVDAFTMMHYVPWLRQAWIVTPTVRNRAKVAGLPHYIASFRDIRWYVPRDIRRILGPALTEMNFLKLMYLTGRPFRRHALDQQQYYWDGARPETIEQYTRQHSDRPPPVHRRPVVVYELL